jgi:SAM-dependent methyltransferase
MESQENTQNTVPFDIWRTSGTTEHIGGVFATQRLLELCHITPDQTVLDLGCGTGYTSCYLAGKHHARVVAMDISPTSTQGAYSRTSLEQVSDRVAVLCADAHHLPFAPHTFDAVIAESVLIFCQVERIVSEAYRVLKRGGIFGDNELALVGSLPDGLQTLLLDTLGIHAFSATDWRLMFEKAGFTEVASTARKMSILEQVISHIKVDGVAGYFTALVKGLSDKEIRHVFVNREMLRTARRFSHFIGYHIYVGEK